MTDRKTEPSKDCNSAHPPSSLWYFCEFEVHRPLIPNPVFQPQESTAALREFSRCPTYEEESRLQLQPSASQRSLPGSRKQPPSWARERQTSEMHHPAASTIGSYSVIHHVADIPQPIRIPFSCNGGEHSWNYRVWCNSSRTDYTLFKPCFKTIKGFFPFNPEIWKQHST